MREHMVPVLPDCVRATAKILRIFWSWKVSAIFLAKAIWLGNMVSVFGRKGVKKMGVNFNGAAARIATLHLWIFE